MTMKKIFALLSVVLVLASCSKDIDTQVDMTAGAMRFAIAAQSDVTAEDSVVIKIYKVENGEESLVRRYDSVNDVPDYLALLAGDYVAKVQVGQRHAVSFDTKCYYGESKFEVKSGATANVTVDCKLQSTIVTVDYDKTVAESLSAGYFTTVAIADSYDKQAIATGDVLSLTYEESKDGYVMMPEGQTSLYWHFEGTHPTEGEIVKEGLIENVKMAARYTIKLKYSSDAPGGLIIDATVDESVEEFDDVIIFSPDPTILGDGFDLTEQQLSTTASRTYNIASLAEISTMKLKASNVEYNLLVSAPDGVTVNKIDNLTYKVTISEAFFAQVAGGEQKLTFHIEDVDGGKLNKEVNYLVQGVMPLSTSDYDLWFGNVTFKATVLNTSASSVKIAYSDNGTTWTEVAATAGENNTYTAVGSDFMAEKNYTYKLVVDSADAGKALTHQTAAGAQMPNGDMESWSNNTTLNGLWSSGNNSFTTLMEKSTDAHSGSFSAKLTAMAAVGKFAAGNLFTGSFELNMSTFSGKVTFGKDFKYTARPRSVTFWMKNNQGDITHGNKVSGKDPYSAMVLITDGATYTVDTTNESSFLTKDNLKDQPGIIAYGYLSDTDSNENWTQKTIELTYVDNWQTMSPKKISVSFSTSAYGDYFCGSTGSWMYVDDIVFNY